MTARETDNYAWDISQVLGRGMMGTVFKGFRKQNGEQVAIKALNRNTPEDYQNRELNLLSQISHENILKLLAIEQEKIEGKTVMIVELCSGGSLLSYLQDPENCYGLPDDEVLLVLEHLKNGIKYLKENLIVHRDIKPGNIMRHIKEDGRSLYKLADFDAARLLPEGEEFESIFGTPAYLAPDLYEQQFIPTNQVPQRRFTESTDLWSIGVTLYHTCTGRLPFIPFEGTENFKVMHYITTKKPSGVISAIQTSPGGAIDWRTKLPDDCLLSAGLQRIFTPLVALLLEADVKKRCSFSDFFVKSEDIISRRRLHMFYVNEVRSLRLYMDVSKQKQNNTYEDLQKSIQEQTNIPAENQLILFKDSNLKSFMEQQRSFLFPRTTQDSPFLLCHRDENNITPTLKHTATRFFAFPNQLNFREDERIAKNNTNIGHAYKRQIEEINRSLNLLNLTALTINQVVVTQLIGVSKENLQIKSVINSLEHQFKMMEAFHKSCRSFVHLIPRSACNSKQNPIGCLTSIVNSMGESFAKQKVGFEHLKAQLQELNPSLNDLMSKRIEHRSLIQEWEAVTENFPDGAAVLTTATNLIHKLRSSMSHLSPDPFAPGHTHRHSHENQVLHLTERLLMQDICKSIRKLLAQQYNHVYLTVIKNFSDWYKTAQVATIQPEILTLDLTNLRNTLSQCELQLNMSVDKFHAQLNNFTDGLRKSYAQTELKSALKDKGLSSGSRHESIKELNVQLKELIISQQELRKTFLDTSEIQNMNLNLETLQ